MALSKGPFIYYVGTFRSRRIPVSIARTVKWANLNIVRNEKKKNLSKAHTGLNLKFVRNKKIFFQYHSRPFWTKSGNDGNFNIILFVRLNHLK